MSHRNTGEAVVAGQRLKSALASSRHPQPSRQRRVPMKKHILVAEAVLLALSFTAGMASAQVPFCQYEHPTSAKSTKLTVVQAFVSCNNPGGNTPNSTTEG